MKPAILFDLDETLISTVSRQYKVIADFFLQHKIPFPLTFYEYTTLRKNNRWSNAQLVSSLGSSVDIKEFRRYYLSQIELPGYLKLDTLLVDIDLLTRITHYEKIIVSLRSSKENSMQQLETLGIRHLFTNIFFLQHSATENPKVNCLFDLKEQYDIALFIGDSDTDCEAAAEAGISYAEVHTGIYKSPRKLSGSINDILKQNFLA